MAKPKAVVVGGSIAGVCCAHALLAAGWDVVVLEKTRARPTGNPTGAGLGLDPLAQKLIGSWISDPLALHNISLPLTFDQVHVTENKISRLLTRDENLNYRSAHWTELYNLLYNAMPSGVVLWGHFVKSFCVSDHKTRVTVKGEVLQTGDTFVEVGDLLIAADGSNSTIKKILIPDFKLRYTGYTAWRGVLDFSNNEHLEAVMELKKAYPDLGKSLYSDMATQCHVILVELKKRINWVWFINQSEPAIEGNSATMKVSRDMIEKMHEAAKQEWAPELARIMGETREPFLNAIYDADPLESIIWDNVVLIGDAAHPSTPHGGRSTNMSILDAAVLGKCLEKWGAENLRSALEEYQSILLPVASKQVLFARRLGRMKQGLSLPDREPFDPNMATPEECKELHLSYMPFFSDVPSVLL